MKARRYETIFIIVPDLKEEEYLSIQKWARNIVRSNGGIVAEVEDWGKKRLAYPIKKKSKGLYILLNYFGNEKVVSELERNMRIREDIVRFLTIKLEEESEVDEKDFPEEEVVEEQGEEISTDEGEIVMESPEEGTSEVDEEEMETGEISEAPVKEEGEGIVAESEVEIKEEGEAKRIDAEEPIQAQPTEIDEDATDESSLADEPLAPDEAIEESGPKDQLDEEP